MEGEYLNLSRIEAERIISILEDTTEKLGFLDRLDLRSMIVRLKIV
jgi:hypothetical protein